MSHGMVINDYSYNYTVKSKACYKTKVQRNWRQVNYIIWFEHGKVVGYLVSSNSIGYFLAIWWNAKGSYLKGKYNAEKTTMIYGVEDW